MALIMWREETAKFLKSISKEESYALIKSAITFEVSTARKDEAAFEEFTYESICDIDYDKISDEIRQKWLKIIIKYIINNYDYFVLDKFSGVRIVYNGLSML